VNKVLSEKSFPTGHMLQLVQGDITSDDADAIVNAANAHLSHGGGVAGIISRKGGSAIQRESDLWIREHGPVSHAEPAVTSGGDLPCRYVIHAVGPVWGEGDEDKKLVDAVTGSLRTADRLKLSSIALPAISTGIFGFPKERAAGFIFSSIEDYFAGNPASTIRYVRIILFDSPTMDAFMKIWRDKGWGK
jgi:O-acetyl-ADP-ribose deacetylase (regulator of RNase III)